MTQRLTDAVDVPRWVDRAGVDHGPQRLPVMAEGRRRWLDISAELVSLYDPALASVSIQADVVRGRTRADERELQDLHAAAVAPYIRPLGPIQAPPSLVDVSGQGLRDERPGPSERWLLEPERVMVRTDDGRRVDYEEPPPDSHLDSVATECIIGRLARDAFGRLGSAQTTPTPTVRGIAAAIPGEVDRQWVDVGMPPKRDVVARALRRWSETTGRPDRQYQEAVRYLGSWDAIIDAARSRRR
jgi:hypothetical protein